MLATSAIPPFGKTLNSTMRATVRASSLVACLAGMLLAQQFLLWQFLGLGLWWPALNLVLVAGGYAAYRRSSAFANEFTVELRLVLSALAFSLLVFTLGGEGRFFYQTSDWQVRNAVLHDLVTYPWPFAYQVRGHVAVLRAPLGLYLLPALFGKLAGLRCAELAFLLQSAAFLTCILSLGAGLFEDNRRRLIALGIFIGFSGMDVIGTWLVGGRLDMHLEWWNVVQFSSTVTLAYWVPMHAIAGWMGAVLYLLWRMGRLTLGAFLACLPLLALVSPLALLGIVPFAAVAGISALRSRSLGWTDFALPVGSLLLSIPSLLYLGSGTASAIGHQPGALNLQRWAVFEILEVIPYLLAIAATGAGRRFGPGTLVLTAVLLLGLPWIQLGSDIPMRASIPALAILSVMLAELVVESRPDGNGSAWRALALVTFLIGTVTPLSESWRALYGRRPPAPTCSYFGVVPGGATTYVTDVTAMRSAIAPKAPTLVEPHDSSTCREIDWRQLEMRDVLA